MPDHADAANQTDLLALDPRLQYIFENEVLHQWAFTVRSVAMMNDALRRADLDAFWFAMDAALGSLANISKVFFPPSSRSQARRRGRQMREAFGVQDDSLLKERALRDAFEHFDERIDRWFQHNMDRPFADRNVAPPGGIVIGRMGPADFMRHFDPTTNVVSVLGDALDLQALVQEVEALVERVVQQHETTRRRSRQLRSQPSADKEEPEAS
jgi:hypothetical protein